MAKPTPVLIEALRATASRLEKSANYQWGHMGSCNCGHLAQELTRLKPAEIHQRAMEKHGDWSEQLNDYCPTSGMLMDDLISEMLSAGLDTTDLKNLERLSDPNVLRRMPTGRRYPKHNRREDVVLYIRCWATLLEDEWTALNNTPLHISMPVFQE